MNSGGRIPSKTPKVKDIFTTTLPYPTLYPIIDCSEKAIKKCGHYDSLHRSFAHNRRVFQYKLAACRKDCQSHLCHQNIHTSPSLFIPPELQGYSCNLTSLAHLWISHHHDKLRKQWHFLQHVITIPEVSVYRKTIQ